MCNFNQGYNQPAHSGYVIIVTIIMCQETNVEIQTVMSVTAAQARCS